ncbi:RagB/SusD family nutrient uptake outer membrane protein [Porphyromonas pogonae]|uniref:RagB/SusD family nutrient uptake outer membrane protein n=1 Tax=Porphyromonas pogonae TaxID=867595 RepID=UPI002E770214|nr:RagB/SusD family nutrient uptake outer membrane protein [Porphyromonas pogonae]
MKNKFFTYAIAIASGVIALSSCTSSFDEYNTNESGVSGKKKEAHFLYVAGGIPQMEQSIYFNYDNSDWAFQIMQNLSADLFSGYLTPPTPFNNDLNNINYFMMTGWNSHSFERYNNNIMKPWLETKNAIGKDKKFSEVYGVALILKVMGMQRMTDIYGPIPYSKYGEGGVSSVYDSQKEIYSQFFKELDEAVKLIRDYQAGPNKDVNALKDYDDIFGGDFNMWLKLANSLRLRVAIRISKVNPDLAKKQGELAMSDKAGVLENKDVLVSTKSMKNPLCIVADAYGDSRMSADMESIMVGLKDPRISKYFSFATDEEIVKKYGKEHYQGIRQGTHMVNKDLRKNYSTLSDAYMQVNAHSTPVQLMTAAEVYFIRAEGVLRGWSNMGGTAQSLYEMGIKTSFNLRGVTGADEYIKNSTNKPTAYEDIKEPKYNSQPVSTVTVAWNDGDDNEKKLEKIITQKWIANWPEGQEAWSEFRRTGYPRLFPIIVNNSAGTIDSKIMIRRLPFPDSERKNNSAELEKAIKLLGGPDNGGTKLWWDTNAGAADGKPNF